MKTKVGKYVNRLYVPECFDEHDFLFCYIHMFEYVF